jgi:ferredoxin-thioredoxin reductase catalytic subunit
MKPEAVYLKCFVCNCILLQEQIERNGSCLCGSMKFILPAEGWKPTRLQRLVAGIKNRRTK